jgi:pantoate--beta-alanine ligase
MSPTEPRIIERVRDLQAWADSVRASGRRIGLVPTMGSLHEGHLSLVRLARGRADRVVVSIFVNPTQFGPGEDFERYPRDPAGDLAKLARLNVDVVFSPGVTDLYPTGNATWVEVTRVTEGLCGRFRPGHFRGVTTVVSRLLLAAKPHVALFGEKDYQQLAAIRRMCRDLGFDVEIVAGPTVREPDGLAMSSRNAYLDDEERRQALSLYAGLLDARHLADSGMRSGERIKAAVCERIEKQPLVQLQYVELADAETLEPLGRLDRPAVLAAAIGVGKTRLIDNILLEGS